MAPQLQARLQQLRTKHSAPSAQAHGLNNLELISGADRKVFNGANCGGSVSRQSPGSQQIICHFCGCDSENPAVDGLSQWAKKLHANSRFSIGSFFNFNGVRWQAIGVQSFSGKIREWDSEDTVWESNSATYTLWWMINQQREIAWLSDYGMKRYWSEKYLPKMPALPKGKKIEYGSWRLEFAAGEFSYQPQVNEKRSTWEYLAAPDKHEAK